MKAKKPLTGEKRLVVGSCISATAIISFIRYLTGPETALSLFYLLPITVTTNYVGYRAGLVISICSAAFWLMADLSMVEMFRHPAIVFLNATFRLLVFLIITRTIGSLNVALEQQRVLARSDPLTGTANRRAFFEMSERELKMARRIGYPLSILYLDLDRFKEINDRFGHQAGDGLLCNVARCIGLHIREIDVVARMGGDEFCVLLIDSQAEATWMVAQKLQAKIAQSMIHDQCPVEISIGAATFMSMPDTVADMVAIGDRLMYTAKQAQKTPIIHKVFETRSSISEILRPDRRLGSLPHRTRFSSDISIADFSGICPRRSHESPNENSGCG